MKKLLRSGFWGMIIGFSLLMACNDQPASRQAQDKTGAAGDDFETAGSAATTSLKLTGHVSKGPVAGAAVNFYALSGTGKKGAKLCGTKVTDANGYFAAKITPAPAKPFLIEVSGGAYVDEVSGNTVTLLATDIMSAAVLPGTKLVNITPVTHMAASRSRQLVASGGSLKVAIASTTAGLAQFFNLANLMNITPAVVNNAELVKTANLDSRNYGLLLAGITQEAADLGVSTAELIKALYKDISDGVFNGLDFSGSAIPMTLIAGGSINLAATAGATDLQNAINKYLASLNNKTNLTAKPIATTSHDIGVNGAGVFYTTTTTLPAWKSGQSGGVTLTATGGTKPYKCSAKVPADLPSWLSISQACVLSGIAEILGGGTSMKITPPFVIIMTDSANPAHSVEIELRVTIIASGPTLTPVTGHCYKGIACDTVVATATGGTAPLYFSQGSLAGGGPPLGTALNLNGHVTGTASATGTYSFTVCAVDLVGSEDCKQTSVVVQDPPSFTLTVSKSGNGKGSVYSDPSGISCGTDCSQKYKLGTEVELDAYESQGHFTGWSGACSGTDPTCTVTMDSAKSVSAEFTKCGEVGESCDSQPCCNVGEKCIPNQQCSWVIDWNATNICYGPCGGGHIDCGDGCCYAPYTVCGHDCYCYTP